MPLLHELILPALRAVILSALALALGHGSHRAAMREGAAVAATPGR